MHSLICSGCGLPYAHKVCPAWGTPVYMDSKHPSWGNEEAIKRIWGKQHAASVEKSRKKSERDKLPS